MFKRYIFLVLSLFLFFGCSQKKEKWVFVLAGQSNMAGRGIVEPQDTIVDPTIFAVNKEMKLEIAKEPLHFYEPSLTGLDCGLSFGKELRSQLSDNIEIVLIPCAVGGSSIDQWVGDSLHRGVKLYSNFKKRMAYGKKLGTIKGVLWHQGESDAHPKKLPLYKDQLEKLFKNFRKDCANDNLTILAGELGGYAFPEEKNANWKALNSILYKRAETDDNLFIVSTKELKSNLDKVHFNSESQRELGKRFAKQYLKIINVD